MRIGFFGDSFCADNVEGSYIDMLSKHYNADIVNTGYHGGNIYDTILLQYKPFIDNPPDISIFCWTSHTRLFHRTVRGLKSNSFERKFRIRNRDVYNAGKEFYTYLYDDEKARFETVGALMHFDTILSSNTNKIVHLWCFEKYYTFNNGKELNIILNDYGDTPYPNHIGNEHNNELTQCLISLL